MGGVYAEEILLRANVDKTKHCNALSNEEVEVIFEALQTLLAAVSGGNLEACIILDDEGDFVDVVPVKLKRYEGCKMQAYDSFNQALDEFYLRVTVAERAVDHLEVDKIKKEAERLSRVVSRTRKIHS